MNSNKPADGKKLSKSRRTSVHNRFKSPLVSRTKDNLSAQSVSESATSASDHLPSLPQGHPADTSSGRGADAGGEDWDANKLKAEVNGFKEQLMEVEKQIHQLKEDTFSNGGLVNGFKEQLMEVEKQIHQLKEDGLDESELVDHINKLHEYNEIKDTAQMVLGHIEIEEGSEEEHENADPQILEESDNGVHPDAPSDKEMPVVITLPCQKIKCLICHRKRKNARQLLDHYEKHHGRHNFTYRCGTCKKTFAKLHPMECHVPKCNPREAEVKTATDFPFGCSLCSGELFKTQVGLSQHERHMHPAAAEQRRIESRQRDIERKRAGRRAAAGVVLDPEEPATESRSAIASTKAWPASCTRIMLEVMVRKGIDGKNVNIDVLTALTAAGWGEYSLKQISSRKTNRVFLALYAEARAAGGSKPDRAVPTKAETRSSADTLDPSPGKVAAGVDLVGGGKSSGNKKKKRKLETVDLSLNVADTLDQSPGGGAAGVDLGGGGKSPGNKKKKRKRESMDPSPDQAAQTKAEKSSSADTLDPSPGKVAAGGDLVGGSKSSGNKKKNRNLETVDLSLSVDDTLDQSPGKVATGVNLGGGGKSPGNKKKKRELETVDPSLSVADTLDQSPGGGAAGVDLGGGSKSSGNKKKKSKRESMDPSPDRAAKTKAGKNSSADTLDPSPGKVAAGVDLGGGSKSSGNKKKKRKRESMDLSPDRAAQKKAEKNSSADTLDQSPDGGVVGVDVGGGGKSPGNKKGKQETMDPSPDRAAQTKAEMECHVPKCNRREAEVKTATDFPFGCSLCSGELFKTQVGLSQHERHMHPAAAEQRQIESRQRDIERKRAGRRAAAGVVLDPEEPATESRSAIASTKAWPASCTRIMLEVMVRKGIDGKNVNIDVLTALTAAGWGEYSLKQISSRKTNRVFLALYAEARAAGGSKPDRAVPTKAETRSSVDTMDTSPGKVAAGVDLVGGGKSSGNKKKKRKLETVDLSLSVADTLDQSPGKVAAGVDLVGGGKSSGNKKKKSKLETVDPSLSVADTLDQSPGGGAAGVDLGGGGKSSGNKKKKRKRESMDLSPDRAAQTKAEKSSSADTLDPSLGKVAAGVDLGGGSKSPGNKKRGKQETMDPSPDRAAQTKAEMLISADTLDRSLGGAARCVVFGGGSKSLKKKKKRKRERFD